MAIGWLELVILGAIVVVFGWGARSSWLGRRWDPVRWAREMGLELTTRNDALVRSYLARTRSLRLMGAILGFLAPHVYAAYRGETLPVPFDWDLFDALVGYLVGAVLAEVTISRPKADVPTAALEPRELSDYLPPVLTKSLRATSALSLALVFVYHIVPARGGIGDDLPPAIVIGPAILVVLVGVELLQRYIVRRPQPVVHGDVVRADDAIRSESVHALAGAGIALELIMASVHVAGIAVESEIQLLRWTLPWIALVCFVLALGSWAIVTRPRKRPGWRPRGAAA
jgi:hypothetical protein